MIIATLSAEENESMNWNAAGVIAEIVSAIAVVISLLFLAFEVRRNRNATESASVDALAEGFNSTNALLASDPELAAIWIKGMSNPTALSEVESMRFIATTQSYINHFSSVVKYHESGLLPEDEWLSHYHSMHHIFNSPGGKWLREKLNMAPAVRAVFDAPLDNPRAEGFWHAPNSNSGE